MSNTLDYIFDAVKNIFFVLIFGIFSLAYALIPAIPGILAFVLFYYLMADSNGGSTIIIWFNSSLSTGASIGNVFVSAANAMNLVLPSACDFWNLFVDSASVIITELARLIENGVHSPDIQQDFSAEHARSNLTANDLRPLFEAFFQLSTLIFTITAGLIKLMIAFGRVLMKLNQLAICGSFTDCSSVCGSPDCFNILVLVWWWLKVIISIITTIFNAIGDFVKWIFRVLQINYDIQSKVNFIDILVALINNSGLVLDAFLATGINFTLTVPDLVWCIVKIESGVPYQLGTCTFGTACRLIFNAITILKPFLFICDDLFGGRCFCQNAVNFLGIQVPCVLNTLCTSWNPLTGTTVVPCPKCDKRFSFFYKLGFDRYANQFFE